MSVSEAKKISPRLQGHDLGHSVDHMRARGTTSSRGYRICVLSACHAKLPEVLYAGWQNRRWKRMDSRLWMC